MKFLENRCLKVPFRSVYVYGGIEAWLVECLWCLCVTWVYRLYGKTYNELGW